jgi:hypothetical protein
VQHASTTSLSSGRGLHGLLFVSANTVSSPSLATPHLHVRVRDALEDRNKEEEEEHSFAIHLALGLALSLPILEIINV